MLKRMFVCVILACAAQLASAATITLTFEGLRSGEAILNYYNGGFGGLGSGPGPSFGVLFGNTALASIDSDVGGNGNFGGEPSPSTSMFFLTGGAAVMTIPTGFSTGFSFYYTTLSSAGSVTVWDGLNGTGNILATRSLPVTTLRGAPDPTGDFSPFFPIGVSFSGIARSVSFGGIENGIGFDNITFGSETPTGAVPEPSTYALMGLSLAALFTFRRK